MILVESILFAAVALVLGVYIFDLKHELYLMERDYSVLVNNLSAIADSLSEHKTVFKTSGNSKQCRLARRVAARASKLGSA
jgi:hypothetical protein